MKRKKCLLFVLVIIVAILLFFLVQNIYIKSQLWNLKAENIEKVHYYFYTGSHDRNDDVEKDLSKEGIHNLVKTLNQVKLTHRMYRNSPKVMYVGGYISYTITFNNGKELRIRPAPYFSINEYYFKCKNYDELKDMF